MPFKHANSVASTSSCLNLAMISCKTLNSLATAAIFSAGALSGCKPVENKMENYYSFTSWCLIVILPINATK